MSQLSLNLIAISVFTITLTSLLGPLVHLPPAVPAVVTVSALGLATLDNLSWQGRGSTLLLEWLAGFSAQHRDRVLHHEAGHFLVAHHLGIPVTDYALSAWEALKKGYPGEAGIQFDIAELEAEANRGTISAQLLNRYCTIWMAGIAAETLTYETVQGGTDDRQKLRAVLTQLGFAAAEQQQKERWALLQAKTLLREHWSAYQALVVAMGQRQPISDCVQILNQPG
jgi:hypothetical protein